MNESIVAPDYPWWMAEAALGNNCNNVAAPLIGPKNSDIVVVGGGYTGLWTALALHAKQPDADVSLLEANVIGNGSSGRNGGFLHGYWEQFGALAKEFGATDALAIARAGSASQNAIMDFCANAEKDVWLTPSGIIMSAMTQAQERAVDSQLDTAAKHDLHDKIVPLTRDQVIERCNNPRFGRGVFFNEAATVQPARLVGELKRAAIQSGIHVYEASPVEHVDGDIVSTRLGSIRADSIVLATNSSFTTHPSGKKSLVNMSSYIILTEPIPDLLNQLGWVNGDAFRDGRMFLHYFRTTKDGRIAFGTGAGPIGYRGGSPAAFMRNQPTINRLVEDFYSTFPTLGRVKITNAWGGPVDMSSDHAPFFGTIPGTRTHYAGGLSGHGVNPSWIAGQVLSSLALDRKDEWTTLPLVRRSPPALPPEPFRYLGGLAIRASLIRGEDARDAGRRPPTWARAGETLAQTLHLRIGTRR